MSETDHRTEPHVSTEELRAALAPRAETRRNPVLVTEHPSTPTARSSELRDALEPPEAGETACAPSSTPAAARSTPPAPTRSSCAPRSTPPAATPPSCAPSSPPPALDLRERRDRPRPPRQRRPLPPPQGPQRPLHPRPDSCKRRPERRSRGSLYLRRRRFCMPPSTQGRAGGEAVAGERGRRSPRRPRRALTRRPIGWRASSAARSASGSSAASSRRPTHGVSAVPGLTQLTRMPSPTWSAAIASVSESTAPLVAL